MTIDLLEQLDAYRHTLETAIQEADPTSEHPGLLQLGPDTSMTLLDRYDDPVVTDDEPWFIRRWPIVLTGAAAAAVVILVLIFSGGDESTQQQIFTDDTEQPLPTTSITDQLDPSVAVPLVDRIALVSGGDIFTIDADGTNLTQLTSDGEVGEPSWSPDGTRIAFSSQRNGTSDIFVMNADGSNVTQLTDGPFWDGHPAWSPDGSRILFNSDRPEPLGAQVVTFVMNADGSDIAEVGSGDFPSWSPDGTRIVAIGSDSDQTSGLILIDADGSNRTVLTDTADLNEWDPAWSPDGEQIAYSGWSSHEPGSESRSDGWQISLIDSDGSNPVILIDDPTVVARYPSWSPNGERIVYHRDGDLYIMDRDGSNQTQLTDLPGDESSPTWGRVRVDDGESDAQTTSATAPPVITPGPPQPGIAYMVRSDIANDGRNSIWLANQDGSTATLVRDDILAVDVDVAWSPDGTRLAYSTGEIFTMNADGSNPVQITNVTGYANYPSWSPDGKQLAFGTDALYIVNADGNDLTQLTPEGLEFHIRRAVWSPDGTKIAFEGQPTSSGDVHIYVLNVDGTGFTNLTAGHTRHNIIPSWSPGSLTIAFESFFDDDEAPHGIFTIEADGTGLTRLTSDSWFTEIGRGVAWSTDGTRAAFGNGTIYTMNADGSDLAAIADGDDPAWSPDGTQLVFATQSGDGSQVVRIEADGSGATTLAASEFTIYLPAWSPATP